MKLTLRLVTTALLFGGSTLFAQVPGMMTMQQASVPQGTDLGANTTVTAPGIALGNRVKLRGFVDFRYDNTDIEYVDHDKRFRTGVDLDLLIDPADELNVVTFDPAYQVSCFVHLFTRFYRVCNESLCGQIRTLVITQRQASPQV